jgi:hypothetical protein
MTEAEWLACTDPEKMLDFLQGKVTDRKLRLFTAACCYAENPAANIPAYDIVERFADGQASLDEVRKYWGLADVGGPAWPEQPFNWARRFASDCPQDEGSIADEHEGYPLARTLPPIARCVFGNPIRRITLDPACVTSTAKRLAETIYADRAFDRLPILADALEEAGCTDADILSHCRGPGPHVRGCWAVDLLLGKE